MSGIEVITVWGRNRSGGHVQYQVATHNSNYYSQFLLPKEYDEIGELCPAQVLHFEDDDSTFTSSNIFPVSPGIASAPQAFLNAVRTYGNAINVEVRDPDENVDTLAMSDVIKGLGAIDVRVDEIENEAWGSHSHRT